MKIYDLSNLSPDGKPGEGPLVYFASGEAMYRDAVKFFEGSSVKVIKTQPIPVPDKSAAFKTRKAKP